MKDKMGRNMNGVNGMNGLNGMNGMNGMTERMSVGEWTLVKLYITINPLYCLLIMLRSNNLSWLNLNLTADIKLEATT
jgi:hypothetical protein